MNATTTRDPHAQLRSLYSSLLQNQERFAEFKELLAHYEIDAEHLDAEPANAQKVREQLNARIREWIGEFDGLNPAQAHQWRVIVVDERSNVALSPWKESNLW